MIEIDSVKRFEVSRGYAYYVFVLLFILYMLDFTDRYVIASLFPYLKADWGLTDTQCGLLMSTVTWAVLVLTLPISVLVDRWSRKKSIGIMAALWSLACGRARLPGISDSFLPRAPRLEWERRATFRQATR